MIRLATLTLLGLLVASPSSAKTIRVELDGSGDVVTIQDALLAASDGDSILIGPGTYTWDNQNTDSYPQRFRGMIQLAKDFYPDQNPPNDLTILGVEGPALTVLDALGRSRVFYTSGNTEAGDDVALRFTLEGLTFRNGDNRTEPVLTNRWGGGAATHLASPTFRNCRFINNKAEVGGGLWTGGQNFALIENCLFRNNLAEWGGGAAAVNSSLFMVTLRDCNFEENIATISGGAYAAINSQVTLERTVMFRNRADERGSGIRAIWTRPLIIRECFVFRGQGSNAAIDVDWGEAVVGETPIQNTFVEIYDTLVARNGDSGIRFSSRVIAKVECTNSVEHDFFNWSEQASPLFGQNGNRSVDPKFCTNQARFGLVCDTSPMLAANDEDCTTDIGTMKIGCSDCQGDEPPSEVTQALPAYPNPFSDSATLEYELKSGTRVRIAVYDLKGRCIRLLVDEEKASGPHTEQWDGRDDSGRRVASGVYLCRFEAGDSRSQRPMVLVN